jgi:hypothetical protein
MQAYFLNHVVAESVSYLTKDCDNQRIPNGEPFVAYAKLPIEPSDKKNLKNTQVNLILQHILQVQH